MNEKLHRFISCVMALMLLVSTTSWTVGKHYCMGHLIDVALFAHAEDCGMDMNMPDDAVSSQMQVENACCTNEIVTLEGQDDLKISFEEVSLDHQILLFALTHSYLILLETGSERLVPNNHYPPPLLVKDIQLLDEVFLI